MKYKIVGDSSCDVTEEMKKRYNIVLAPLTFRLDDEEFVDDESLDLDYYLSKVNASANVPKSACPSIYDYMDRFAGEEEWVFGITISSELSGSYNSAVAAKDQFLSENPGKKVHIFNSLGAASKEVLIALKIAKLVEEGKSFDEVVEGVDAYIKEAVIIFVLDNIDTLEKNGRLSLMKAKIVRVLNLKLILRTTEDGEITMMDKARGSKKALIKMVKKIGGYGVASDKKKLVIAECQSLDKAEFVKELVEKSYNFEEIIIVKMGGLSSTYANTGGIIMSY